MPDPRLSPAITRALRGAMQAAEVERARALEDAEIPGTLPGLGGSTLYSVPLSAAERDANAQVARERAASRRSSSAVDVPGLARELGDIASMYGAPGIERAIDVASASPLMPTNEYDPQALATRLIPIADEAIAAAESLTGNQGYRARQAQLEQQFRQAQERSPGSAALGDLSLLGLTAPLMPAASARALGGAGAVAGGIGGALGSEGESLGRRAYETLSGAATLGTLGYGAGRLMQAGNALRAAPLTGTMADVGRFALGTAAEGAGTGAGYELLSTPGTVREGLIDVDMPELGDQPLSALTGLSFSDLTPTIRAGQLGRDVATGAGLGALTSVPFGIAGGMLRGGGRRVPGLAEDVADVAGDIDETALIAEQAPGDEIIAIPTTASAATAQTPIAPSIDMRSISPTGITTPDAADLRRLEAAGALDRQTRDRIALAFNPGNARAGVRTAARIARESGISPPGFTPRALSTTIQEAERVRDESQAVLSRLHQEIASMPIGADSAAMADRLESEAARVLSRRSPNAQTIAYASALRDRADDLRYGSIGPEGPLTHERAAYERLRAAPDITDAAQLEPVRPPPLPGAEPPAVVEPEIRGVPMREVLPAPRQVAYQENRQEIQDIFDQLDMENRGRMAPAQTPRAAREFEHRVRVAERNRLAELALGSRYRTEMVPANMRYRLASTLAPRERLGNAARVQPGWLTSQLAGIQAGGGFGPDAMLARMRELGVRQYMPAFSAAIAEASAAPIPSMRLALPAIVNEYSNAIRSAIGEAGAARTQPGAVPSPGATARAAAASRASGPTRIAADSAPIIGPTLSRAAAVGASGYATEPEAIDPAESGARAAYFQRIEADPYGIDEVLRADDDEIDYGIDDVLNEDADEDERNRPAR